MGISLGVIMLTSIVGVLNLNPSTDNSKFKDIEMKREQKLDIIDKASMSWQQGLISKEQFAAIIEQSIMDTDALREEYLSLDVPPKYDKYKRLSIDSLDQQRQAFLKLKEYVQAEDPEAQQSIRAEFDELMVTSFEYRKEALQELES